MKKLCILLVVSILTNFGITSLAAEPNIITNSKMDKLTGWTGVGSGSIVIDSSQHPSDEAGSSLKVNFNSGDFYDVVTNINMAIGKTYTVSFDAKGTEDGIHILPIRFLQKGYGYMPTQMISTKWEHYSFEYTQPDVNSSGEKIDGSGTFALRIQDTGTVWLDNVKIVDADYVPEEEDVEKPDYYMPYRHKNEERKQQILSFDDIHGHWAEEVISILKTENIINGIDEYNFEPDRYITRAEFITLFMSLLNVEDNDYKNGFSDVFGNDWYSGKIQNASELGLISPLLIQNGNLKPNEEITREDACVFIDSFSEFKCYENIRTENLFADDGDISDYARYSVSSAYRKGIIDGKNDGCFKPIERLTRAEASQILMRVIEKDGKIAVFVDPDNGSDSNDGTKFQPIKTFKKAQEIVRDANDDMEHNIYVLIKSGEYFIDKPLEFTTDDSGNNGCSVIYTSYGSGKAFLSGGNHIKPNWQVDDAKKGIYKTYVGTEIQTRQMFVNGLRMTRARTKNGFESENSKINPEETGYITGDTYFLNYRNIRDMELVYYQEWTNPRCGVDKLIKNNDGTLTLTMERPCWDLLMNKEHLKISNPVYFENQYEFIDEAGEWYLDSNGWLYYKPFDFIDLNTADVVLPVTERLLSVSGSSNEQVQNLAFINLGFKYAGWMRPSTNYGYSDSQGGRLRDNGEKLPDSAVWIKYAKKLRVSDCEFSKLGITALNVTDWIEDTEIVGNHLYDLSGAGMYVGNHGEDGGATGDAYLSQRIKISNNLVHDYGIDYGSSDGIECMTMSYADISHNEVYNGRYSGLTLGYGAAGTKYSIDFMWNYVHDVLNDKIFDGGSIYVTKETSGTEERRNRVAYNYTSRQGNWSANLYNDNASTYWEFDHNVVNQKDKPTWNKDGSVKPTESLFFMSNGRIGNVVHDNYVTTLHNAVSAMYLTDEGPVATLENNYEYKDANWPDEAKDIILKSGLEKEYSEKYLSGIEVVDLKSSEISLKPGETANIKEYMIALGRKEVSMDLSSLNMIFETNNPDILSVLPDGTIKSLGEGVADLKITIINGDLMYYKTAEIFVGDSFEKLSFPKNEIQQYVNSATNIMPKAISKLGSELKPDTINFTSDDINIAKVDENGLVTALSEGNTKINVAASWKGEEKSYSIPIVVKQKIDSDVFSADNYLITNWDNAVLDNDFWIPGLTGDKAETDESGTTFSTPANTVASSNLYGDELLHTRIRVNADGGWPSLCLRVKNQYETYNTNTSYMVTFNKGSVEVQKFVLGKRRTYETGAGAKCNFEYNKDYDLMIGAVNHEDNVEIIVCIDGNPVLRFRDYDEDRITEEGYIQVYARSGSISLLRNE